MIPSIGVRRIGAYLVDYIVILLWMSLLLIAASAGWIGVSADVPGSSFGRWILQGQAFLWLTLPVYLYFTLFEALGRQATIGKRLLRLRVAGSVFQIALRNTLKFLPWELAHTGIWHGMIVPFQASPTPLGWSLFTLSMGLSLLYLMTLFIGHNQAVGRALYDHIAGTSVQVKSV